MKRLRSRTVVDFSAPQAGWSPDRRPRTPSDGRGGCQSCGSAITSSWWKGGTNDGIWALPPGCRTAGLAASLDVATAIHEYEGAMVVCRNQRNSRLARPHDRAPKPSACSLMRRPICRPPKRRAVIGAKLSQRENRRWQGFAEKIFPIIQLISGHGAINAIF